MDINHTLPQSEHTHGLHSGMLENRSHWTCGDSFEEVVDQSDVLLAILTILASLLAVIIIAPNFKQ